MVNVFVCACACTIRFFCCCCSLLWYTSVTFSEQYLVGVYVHVNEVSSTLIALATNLCNKSISNSGEMVFLCLCCVSCDALFSLNTKTNIRNRRSPDRHDDKMLWLRSSEAPISRYSLITVILLHIVIAFFSALNDFCPTFFSLLHCTSFPLETCTRLQCNHVILFTLFCAFFRFVFSLSWTQCLGIFGLAAYGKKSDDFLYIFFCILLFCIYLVWAFQANEKRFCTIFFVPNLRSKYAKKEPNSPRPTVHLKEVKRKKYSLLTLLLLYHR